ncbi:hypothetical protein [uncultured Bacteroides sp.]|uniref:hypothetical protein n=1 Tax=uncultured Bacteroides sp. TaxID=162156 RepID=UPI002AAB3DF4|nr:hypothetical protein [uncultured Bacteroides sp.]
MITTKIQIKAHLAEYAHGKFAVDLTNTPVRFSDNLDIYHKIFDLLEKRPSNCSRDCGNLEIILPDRREGGKSPETYNYLGLRSQQLVERKIEIMMFAEIHDLLDENKHVYGIDFIDSVHYFMKKYCIESISEDAFLKNYQRWRDNQKRRSKKRSYKRVQI